jgi:hypothetical protein
LVEIAPSSTEAAVLSGSGLLAEIYGWFTEGFDTADFK